MKIVFPLSLVSLLFLSAIAIGQTSSDTTKICKGLSIPEGYTIVNEVASSDCTKGAYLIKKSNTESSDTSVPKSSANPTTVDSAASAVRSGVKQLHEVNKIYIGDMGKSDESERFRQLLNKTLADKKFIVVDKPEEADATLQGIISTQLSEGTTKARASVQLKSASGQRLWSGDFGVHLVLLASRRRDSVKLRAEDVADGLREDWKKSAKKAGI